MRHALALIAVLAISASAMGAQAAAPCRDAKGKFVKCAAASAYKLDAKGNCHDAKGKMAKKTMCAAK